MLAAGEALDLDLTAEDFTLDPDAALLPTIELDTDLGEFAAPPELAGGQDDVVEGRGGPASTGPGAIPTYVRPRREALALAVSYARDGRTVTPGYCLRESRQYFNVAALYAAAKLSLAGAQELGVAHRVAITSDAVARIPRGAIVYWTGPLSQYGHIAPSLGDGMVLSTDWPRGRYGKVRADVLAAAWGYTEMFWAPTVNDVRVWRPNAQKPASTPLISRVLTALADDRPAKAQALLERLAEDGDGDRPREAKQAARKLLRAFDLNDDIADLRAEISDLQTRRNALRRAGGQSLRNLKVA
ncbi:hypothetical protein [Nocardioides bruguierae]|uniref:CHAP domain-containing protein n=1 Tax=Nocardioides bruguierae TaxID=2945102 RepID=A0A9X2II11_9ACTN|nr:hypothetical protein [Nocardioides bruguierae]MCM0622345.1 hypothetical protein [Nocardioides bruguierae]